MDKTALLVMDVQAGVTGRMALPPTYLPLLSKTINAARSSSVKVIYATISFRLGHPEIAASNPTFYAGKKAGAFVAKSPETRIDPATAPQEGDILVEKKRVSAFAGSGLDMILRSLGIGNLVLTGISTGGVVLSTVCEAADKDFGLVILRDLCLDTDEALHNTLMDNIFKKRGNVLPADTWLESLKA
ncbi:isochorismatase family protein [Xylogone sp. PMI_703]|nr:isochorismatase family protein [Xylogone sp. PMI_703]